ncbi:MAG TPA: shikimate dehydrogenase [Polyangia bacterium]|jgi:shikimate dehydrogenase
MIRAAVLGTDVSKSRSPAIHNAAFRALGVEGDYGAISVAPEGFDARVADLRAQGYRYVNVTIPHKAAAFALAGRHGPEARVSGAVNTLLFEADGGVRGENTDGAGLLAALADLGVAVGPGRVVVMAGAGGAAAGAVEALTRAGAEVRLIARRPDVASALRARLLDEQRARVTVAPWEGGGLARALAGAAVLVSAVPAAAWSDAATAAGLDALAGAAVLEMAYGAETPLAVAARGKAGRYADGLGMLVHQAAHAIALALGKSPPLAPLFAAVQRAV